MPPLAAVPKLDEELDALYGLPLDEWTKARNDLAARLKKANQAEQAEAVRTLRKPSAVAWAVNQLARREPRRVTELLRAGESLRSAQEQALHGRGGASDVSAAARAERAAVRDLVAAAREILEEAGNAASPRTLDRVSQTLRAAAVDDSGRELLDQGRLDEELSGVGFGSLAAVEPRARPRPTSDELKRARARSAELRSEARRLEKEARAAEAAAERAQREAAQARGRADEARREAERVATELVEADAEVERLRS
jgi:hypothetical protein